MTYYAVVRGPLGIGKTTVSLALTGRLRGEYVSIDRILDEHQLETWEDGYISLGSFVRANEIAAAAARGPLSAGSPVFIDGNFYFRAQIDDLVRRLPGRHFVFTLRAPIEVCHERDRNRAQPQGMEGVRAVYAKSTEFDAGIGVDATRPLDVIVAEIVRQLPEGL